MVVGCRKDWVYAPMTFGTRTISKETVGIMTVGIDIISVLIISLFLSKLGSINDEYLNIMDNMIVQMTDFGVYAYNLRIDKHSQDQRVVKMKLWLHMNKVLKPYRSSKNKL